MVGLVLGPLCPLKVMLIETIVHRLLTQLCLFLDTLVRFISVMCH